MLCRSLPSDAFMHPSFFQGEILCAKFNQIIKYFKFTHMFASNKTKSVALDYGLKC